MSERPKELSKIKIACLFPGMMILQLAAAYLGTIDVVPSYQSIKFGLAALLHLPAFTLFGFLVHRALFKSAHRRLLRTLALSTLGCVLLFNLWLTIISAEDDTRSGFTHLTGRSLENELDYPEFNKNLYVYEWSGIPDGHIGTEIKLRKGISPFACRIGKFRERVGEVVRVGDLLNFKEASSPRTVLSYNLRSEEIWVNPDTSLLNSSDD
jgi:hypothetical protein